MAQPARSYLVLDIETVPDRALHTPEPTPGNERPFPPLYACQLVVLGGMWLDQDLAVKRLGTFGQQKDEAGMLGDFTRFMAGAGAELVTWSGRTFDMPVLVLRSLRHGLPLPWYYQQPAYRHRYSAEGHLDLCDYLSDHGAGRMTSLDGAARLIGLPGKDGVDGSQVETMYQAGQLDEIRRYCLRDVTQTAFLFLRYRLLAGLLDRAAYRKAAGALLAVASADPRLDRLTGKVDRQRLLLDEI